MGDQRFIDLKAFVAAIAAIGMLAQTGFSEPFAALTFDGASAQAKADRKLVFIDFYTTWCGPCKMLDETTWKDKAVGAWLAQQTIPIRVDAEKEAKLAERYNVDSYPTLLFVRPDGTEVDRIVGYVNPSEFLEQAKGALSGKDALTRAKEKLAQGGADDPMARMKYAQKLRRNGKQEEALQEYLWCFDEGLKHSMAFAGVRLSFLLSDIADLARTYPPAREAMVKRRDAAEKRLLSGSKDLMSALEYTSLNQSLHEDAKGIALYDRLRREQPDAEVVSRLREALSDELLKQRRYAELAEGVDFIKRADDRLEIVKPSVVSSLFLLKYSKEQREQIRKAGVDSCVRQLSEDYQILIGLGRFAEAEKLAEKVLATDAGAETYNQLAWNGYLTGKPTEANLNQARKAYDLSQGNDPAVIDTLARVLDSRGKHIEAVELLTRSLGRLTSEPAQKTLTQCLNDLGGVRQPPAWKPYVLIVAVLILVMAVVSILKQRRAGRPGAASREVEGQGGAIRSGEHGGS